MLYLGRIRDAFVRGSVSCRRDERGLYVNVYFFVEICTGIEAKDIKQY